MQWTVLKISLLMSLLQVTEQVCDFVSSLRIFSSQALGFSSCTVTKSLYCTVIHWDSFPCLCVCLFIQCLSSASPDLERDGGCSSIVQRSDDCFAQFLESVCAQVFTASTSEGKDEQHLLIVCGDFRLPLLRAAPADCQCAHHLWYERPDVPLYIVMRVRI